MDRQQVTSLFLAAKAEKGLTWDQLAAELGRTNVGAAMVGYGYFQLDSAEADKVVRLLGLPAEAKAVLMTAPHRKPQQPWPPTDPFIYRFYEIVMLYGPVWKDVSHEIFGDGIISAIDCLFEISKFTDDHGIDRANFSFKGKWLVYKKY